MKTAQLINNWGDACGLLTKDDRLIENKESIIKVGILDCNNGVGFEFGCVTELFIKQPFEFDCWYQGHIVDTAIFKLPNVARISAALLEFDMLIITDVRWLNQPYHDALLKSLRIYNQAGGRLVSFGSGMFVLAQAGLLNGRTVPGDPNDMELLREYPKIEFSDQIPHSFGPHVYCAGYGFKSLELGLYLIGKDWGLDCARALISQLNLAPSIIHDIELRLNNQNCESEKSNHVSSSRLRAAMDWAQLNLEVVENVDQLAEKAFLSRRSFDRQFRAAMGLSAKDWLTDCRLSLAKEYLNQSELSIEEIATLTGFGNSNNFRNNFVKALGRSPSAFRRES